MAIGLSRMFGVRLPLNFDSPYKARNIIEFWRRWHMTLSRFLRDYLYIPLGGNRHGTAAPLRQPDGHDAARRPVARRGWTFVIWGGLHGIYLVINHAWQAAAETSPEPRAGSTPLRDGGGRARHVRRGDRSLDVLPRDLARRGAAHADGDVGRERLGMPTEWKGALDATLGAAASGLRFDRPHCVRGLKAESAGSRRCSCWHGSARTRRKSWLRSAACARSTCASGRLWGGARSARSRPR